MGVEDEIVVTQGLAAVGIHMRNVGSALEAVRVVNLPESPHEMLVGLDARARQVLGR
jgi:hypothetical protein